MGACVSDSVDTAQQSLVCPKRRGPHVTENGYQTPGGVTTEIALQVAGAPVRTNAVCCYLLLPLLLGDTPAGLNKKQQSPARQEPNFSPKHGALCTMHCCTVCCLHHIHHCTYTCSCLRRFSPFSEGTHNEAALKEGRAAYAKIVSDIYVFTSRGYMVPRLSV